MYRHYHYHRVVSLIITYKDKIPDKSQSEANPVPQPKAELVSSVNNDKPQQSSSISSEKENVTISSGIIITAGTTPFVSTRNNLCFHASVYCPPKVVKLSFNKEERRLSTICQSYGVKMDEKTMYEFKYDSDSEDDFDRQRNNFLSERKTKILYKNNQWVITNKERCKTYGHDLELESVDTIVKVWYKIIEPCGYYPG